MTQKKAQAKIQAKAKPAEKKKSTAGKRIVEENWPPKQVEKQVTAKAPRNGKLLEAAKAVLPRLQSGETTLSAERDRLGLKSNGALRKALTQLLGGKAKYHEMMAAHSHRHVFQKGEGGTKVAIDDSNVPVITSARKSDGWKTRMFSVAGWSYDVIISPEGKEYIKAGENAKADLIYDHSKGSSPELGKTRWRLLETSGLQKKADKEEKMVVQRKKAKKAKRLAKKERKAAAPTA